MGILALAADERVADVRVTEDELSVRLWDGRTISVPLTWYPRLLNATEEQRKNWRISGGGYGIHWEDIDEDLSTEGLLRGAPAPRQSLTAGKWFSQQSDGQVSNKLNEPAIAEAVGPDNEKRILDCLAEASEASRELRAIMETMGLEAKDLATKIQQHSLNANRLTSESDNEVAEDRLKFIRLILSDTDTFSEGIEGMLPKLQKTIQTMEESFSAIVSQAKPDSRDDVEKIALLKNTLSSILEEVGQPKEATISFRNITNNLMHNLGNNLINENLNREINESYDRQAQALNGIISNIEEIESFILRLMYQINEKFGKALAPEKATE